VPQQPDQQLENGTQSRIYDPASPPEPPPRRRAAVGEDDEHVERDPKTGRFMRPGFSAKLITRARHYGLTDDDLADIDSPEDLQRTVSELAQTERLSRMFNPQAIVEAARARDKGPEPVAAAVTPLDLGLSDEEDGPRLKGMFEKMTAFYEDRIAKLEKRLGDRDKADEAQQQQAGLSFAKKVEKCFAKHRQIFGEGSINDLDRTSPEFHFRVAAVAYHRNNGGAMDDLAENIDDFVKARFGGRSKAVRRGRAPEEYEDEYEEPDEELDEAEEWERGVLRRPTQAGPREAPPGVDKAKAGVKKRMASYGQANDSRKPRGIYLKHPGRDQQRQR
jgi:hypothetical protein